MIIYTSKQVITAQIGIGIREIFSYFSMKTTLWYSLEAAC